MCPRVRVCPPSGCAVWRYRQLGDPPPWKKNPSQRLSRQLPNSSLGYGYTLALGNDKVRGVLRLLSRSLVFDPDDNQIPMLKVEAEVQVVSTSGSPLVLESARFTTP